MAIKVPGKRDRNGRLKRAARSAVATLSLTAMVDMFTVLVVFLLMNYQTTGEVLPLKENVTLPQAASVSDLEPSNLVVVGRDGVEVNGVKVETLSEVAAAEDWILLKLEAELKKQIRLDKEKEERSLSKKIQAAVQKAKSPDVKEAYKPVKVTIQADKSINILLLKKVMYTITESGGEAINFAVLKQPKEGS